MSENLDNKLKGMVEYLSLISDMMTQMKLISDKYGINPSKMNEDGTMDLVFAEADPTVIGLLVTTMMRYKTILDKPMENLDGLDTKTLEAFNENIKKIRKIVFKGDNDE